MYNYASDKQTVRKHFAAPTFSLENENNAIDAGSSIGTPIQIAPYPQMQVGDIIILHMAGFDKFKGGKRLEDASFLQAHRVLEHNLIEGCGFFFPEKQLTAITCGRAEARYEVFRDGLKNRSKTAHVLIDLKCGAFPF